MSANTAVQTVALSQLRLSPKNTRQRRDPEAIESMAASIQHHGLLQNLIVEPAANDPDTFEVLAGGTRLAAMERLVSDGKLASDYPVRVLVETNGQAIEASAAENLVRTRLSPAEEFDAFKAMADNGKSRDEIAQHFGVARIVVDRSLKLANVNPQLLQIFRDGGMELDQLRALALTDDHEFQRKVWFGVEHRGQRMAYQIREKITNREVRAGSELARFVSLDAYEAAGGVVRRDLFGKDAWLTDRPLLESLAMDRLEAKAQQLRAEGWSWAEAHLSLDYSQRNEYPRGFNPDLAEQQATPEQQHCIEDARHRLSAIAKQADAGYFTAEEEEQLLAEQDQLEAELEELEAQIKLIWPAHVLEQSGCLVTIVDGSLHVDYGRLRPGQKATPDGKITGKARDPGAEQPGAKDAPKKATLSGDMQHRLHLHRRAALRVALTKDHSLAIELLLAQLLTDLFTSGNTGKLFDIQLRIHHAAEVEGKGVQLADVVSSPARKVIDAQVATLKAKLPKKAAEVGPWLATQSVDQLLELFALVAAVTLLTSEAQAAALARAAKIDMCDWWQPDAAHYLGLVPKALIADAVQDVHGKAAAEKIEAMKKDAAVAEAGKLLAKSGWLPKPLRHDGYALAKPGTAAKAVQDKAKATKPAAPAKTTGKAAKKAPAKKAPTKKAAAPKPKATPTPKKPAKRTKAAAA